MAESFSMENVSGNLMPVGIVGDRGVLFLVALKNAPGVRIRISLL